MGDDPFREPFERFGPYVVRGHFSDGVHVVEGPDGPAELRLYALEPNSDVHRIRFETEMGLLARLLRTTAHPAIRPICATGTLRDTGWLAAPPSTGLTLSEWCTSQPRPWSDVVSVLCAVGEAILVVHDVVVDLATSDIRVDLMGRPHLDVAHSAALRLAAHCHEEGYVPQQGPRYHSPEYIVDMRVSSRTPQFVFCAVAWEALHHSPPFSVTSPAAYITAITTGKIVTPPTMTGVPARIRRALTRGLAADPAMRWPSLGDLLASLAPHRSIFGEWGR